MDHATAADNTARVARYVESLATRAVHTRQAYARDVATLCALAGDEPLTKMTRVQIARHLATLHGHGLSGRSLARMLSVWRAFFRHLIEVDPSIGEDPCAGLKAPKSPRRLPSALSPDEAAKLVTIEDGGFLAVRDRAMFELAYSSGLRLSELAGVDLARLDLAGGEVRVLGKGSKERIVPVGAAARDALTRWLGERAKLPNVDARAVFVGQSGRRLSPRAIELRLAQWAVRQGLTQHVHPH
ncbi:MAG TPA: tyrosine-type recombinase/integrase, partial [Casimicrobiaceae bacterium]